MPPVGNIRIGELARRVGVAPELLRAWESRYGLVVPIRSPGGFRLYSADDERRVRAMLEHLRRGYSASEAARLAAAEGERAREGDRPELVDGLRGLASALDAFDEAGANAALDRLLAAFTVEMVLHRVVLPYLRELGERWERGEASVAQEHFASNLLRARLLGLARGWGGGVGPRALLACTPRELHDLALIVFGLALRGGGWRVTYLGPDTPPATLASAAEELRPDLVAVAATTEASFEDLHDDLHALSERWRLALGGPGATPAQADALGAELLAGDPIAAAEAVIAPPP